MGKWSQISLLKPSGNTSPSYYCADHLSFLNFLTFPCLCPRIDRRIYYTVAPIIWPDSSLSLHTHNGSDQAEYSNAARASSEYYSKADATGTPGRTVRNLNKELVNGSATHNGDSNGSPNGQPKNASGEQSPKQAGALQLLFAVGGIYGSL